VGDTESRFLVLQRHAVLLTNAYALAELERNIMAKQPEHLAVHKKFTGTLELVSSHVIELDVRIAEKDRPILCGAVIGKADILLTGDKKDFGHLFGRMVCGIEIVTVKMLLARLVARGLVTEQ
jgi:uncharacterized protein